MKTWRGLAVENRYVGKFDDGREFHLERGKDYCLASVDNPKDGHIFLMSRCWEWVPADWFCAIKPECGHGKVTK